MNHDQQHRQETPPLVLQQVTSCDLIQHAFDVPVETAHLVMTVSDLVWLFGPRMLRWNKPHLLVAAQHFHLPTTPAVSESAFQYEQGLLESVLLHLQGSPSHRFVVLYRQGTGRAGWVCLVPTGDFGRVQQLLAVNQLVLSPAGWAEVLQ